MFETLPLWSILEELILLLAQIQVTLLSCGGENRSIFIIEDILV